MRCEQKIMGTQAIVTTWTSCGWGVGTSSDIPRLLKLPSQEKMVV